MPAVPDPSVAGYVAKMDALAPLMSSVKTIFGWCCLAGAAVLLLFLLYDVEPVRRTLKKMPKSSNVDGFSCLSLRMHHRLIQESE